MPQFLEHSTINWKGQKLKHQLSVIDDIDPRLRIVFSACFAILVVSFQHYPALLAGFALSLAVALMSKVNVKRTMRRVLAMDFFMIFLLLLLPFSTPGEIFFQIGGLSASWEGLHKALVIILKANAIILLLLTAVGTLDASTLGHALKYLKVPEKLIHLMLFTVRYLEVINREYKRMRAAMRCRGFVPKSNLHTWRSIGYLLGMLLIRSLERSERILAAMKCRGFNGRFYLLDHFMWRRSDTLYSLGAVLLLLVLGLVEVNSYLAWI